jgi:hypothetical protein
VPSAVRYTIVERKLSNSRRIIIRGMINHRTRTITIDPRTKHKATTLLHEIGHALDWAIAPQDRYSSNDSDLRAFGAWRRLVVRSAPMTALRHALERLDEVHHSHSRWRQWIGWLRYRRARKAIRYQAAFPECFARVYVQFIARHAMEPTLLEQYQSAASRYQNGIFRIGWSDVQFAEIDRAMTDIFAEAGLK